MSMPTGEVDHRMARDIIIFHDLSKSFFVAGLGPE